MLTIIKQSQDTYTNVTFRMKIVKNTKKEILELMENFRSTSKVAAILYFTLTEMQKLDSVYDFTFEYVTAQFWKFLNINYTPN